MKKTCKIKLFSTFYTSNLILQKQYQECRLKNYFELICCLLVVKQNNKMLTKKHQARPIGSVTFPEVNVASSNWRHHNDRECGHGHAIAMDMGMFVDIVFLSDMVIIWIVTKKKCKWKNNETREYVQYKRNKMFAIDVKWKVIGFLLVVHLKHLVNIYQASIKATEKEP